MIATLTATNKSMILIKLKLLYELTNFSFRWPTFLHFGRASGFCGSNGRGNKSLLIQNIIIISVSKKRDWLTARALCCKIGMYLANFKTTAEAASAKLLSMRFQSFESKIEPLVQLQNLYLS
jgi:hypothetical protein